MRKECLIFDFDGVIANTDQSRFKNLSEILQRYNIHLPPDYFNKLVGLTTVAFLKKYFPFLPEEQVKNISKERQENYYSNLAKYCIPFEGMKNTIDELSNHFKIVMVTSNAREKVITQLKHLNVYQYFDWIIGREDTENNKLEKSYLKVPSIIDKDPEKCIVIEDSEIGVQAAKEADFYCIKFVPLSTNDSNHTAHNDIARNYPELKKKILNFLE
ncbi:MAG: HAD family hydrolase [bacterium]